MGGERSHHVAIPCASRDGDTLDIFHSSGKYPHLMDRLIIWVREGTISGQASFKSLAGADAIQRRRVPSSELMRPLRQFRVCVVRLVVTCTVPSRPVALSS